MSAAMKLGVVLLAAGRSVRFGSSKLLADFGGRPLICRALEALRAVSAQRICVVTGCEQIAELARREGMDVIINSAPELGQAHSIHLGVQAMDDMDAVLLLVGDQPLLTGESLARLVFSFEGCGKGIACLQDQTHAGNPAVFSKRYYPELLALAGDRGARGILKTHSADLRIVDCVYPGELADVDTPEALERL